MWTLAREFFRQAMVTSSSNQNVQLCQFISKLSLFENLGPQSLNQLARALTKQSYLDGDYIIKQGELGDKFYVMFKGNVVCTKTDDMGHEIELVRLKEGDVFGEHALLKKEPRAANVIAIGSVECYYLDSYNFSLILGGLIGRLNEINEFRILRGAVIFEQFTDRKLRHLQKLLPKSTLLAGQKLYCKSSNSMFLILSGTFQDDAGNVFGVGHVTGEIDGSETSGDLTAFTDEAAVLTLHRQTVLEHLHNPEAEIAEGDAEMRNDSQDPDSVIQQIKRNRYLTTTSRKDAKLATVVRSLEELNILDFLGRGTFGAVYLAESSKNKMKFAVKALDKESLIASKQHNFIKREIIALQLMHHPFIVDFYRIFESARKIYLLMEFVPGVELWGYMLKYSGSGAYGGIPIEHAKMFAANALLALEHIHNQGYVYRDLKV